jgi:hypothetical protein
MKNALLFIIGVLLIIAGVLGGFYVSLWVCFVGGIVQVVEACKATPIDALDVGLGLLRFVCSSLAGWITFIVVTFIGSCFCAAGGSSRSGPYSRRW